MKKISFEAHLLNTLSMTVPIIYHVGWEIQDQKWSCPTPANKRNIPHMEYDTKNQLYVRSIPYHWIMMVLEGDVEIYLKSGKYSVEKNMLVNLPPGSLHHICSEKPTKYVWIHYKIMLPKPYDQIMPPLPMEEESRILHNLNFYQGNVELPVLIKPRNADFIRKIIVATTEEFMLEEPGYILASRANLQLLLTLLFRDVIQEKEHKHSVGISNPFIAKAIEYIHQYYADKLSISKLANLVNLSPNYFISLFGELTGFSPGEYILRVRISQSKKFMKDTNYNLSEIALTVGFDSLSHFSRTFNKIEGISPKFYRQMLPRG